MLTFACGSLLTLPFPIGFPAYLFAPHIELYDLFLLFVSIYFQLSYADIGRHIQ